MLRRMEQCFLLYSFLGWVLEGMFNLTQKGTFQKPNFLHGPVKPMYGFAGVLLAASYKLDKKHFGWHASVLPLLVEYVSAWWLETQYKLKYWDYSRENIQLKGRICLKFALCWVILAQVAVHIVQPFLNGILRITGGFSVWKTLLRVFLADCAATMYQRRKQGMARKTVKQLA